MSEILKRLDEARLLREDRAFNGWSSYESWCLHVWLTGDENTYSYCLDLARDCVEEAGCCSQVRDGIWTEEQARRFLLADRLKSHIDDQNPLNENASLFSDLAGAALDEVDWTEVADALLSDI